MTRPPPRSAGRRRYAVLRPRDSEGRFLPVGTPHPGRPHPLPLADTPPAASPSDTPSQLLEEFRNYVDDAWPQLCRGVIGQAIEGNRWALQMVFQYTVGDWRLHIVEPDQESRLHRYLAEIAHAMREPDGDNTYDPDGDNTYGPDSDPDDHDDDDTYDPDANPDDHIDNGNPYDPAS